MPNFSESYITKLPPAQGCERYEVKDDLCNGLYCRVTNKGTKSYSFFRKVNGKFIRVTIGRCSDISLKNARLKVSEIFTLVSNGINPNIEKQKLRKEITLKELFNEYMERHSKKYTKEISWKENEEIYKRYFSNWDLKKISSITTHDIENLHSKIGDERGIYAANKALTLIKHIYNKGIEWGFEGKNPAIGIRKYKTKSRDRILQPEEFKSFYKALNEVTSDTARDFFYMAIYTGQRKRNVLAMKWEEINFNTKYWHIPETKNGESVDVPLVPSAVELLKERYKSIEKDPIWVFPSKNSASGHFEEPRKAWENILRRAGIKNLRIHDLRRTFGSYLAISGASSSVIRGAMAHKSEESIKTYVRLQKSPVIRDAMTNMINMIDKLSDGEA